MGRQSTEYRKFVRDTLTELKRKIVEVSSDPSHQFALQADQLLSHFDLDAVESGLTRVYLVDTRTQEGKDSVRFTGKVKEATFLPQPVTLADKLLEGIRLPSTAASGSNPGGDGLVVVVDLGQVAELNTAINSPSAPSNLLEALGAPGMSARLSLAGNLCQ